jgi:hypothetical protein
VKARRRERGQTLVELALILPVLLLIVLVAIDFGRAFFGYVVLTNASRIGANFAASHPAAWGTPGNAADQADYEELILRDTDVANCALVGGTPPDPTFTDGSDTGTTKTDVGDRVDVGLTCTFTPITPIVSAVIGSSLEMSANSDFAIRAGTVSGVPVPPPPTPGPTPVATPTPIAGATPTPTPLPGPTPTPTPVPTPSPTPIGNCAVPDFVGTKRNDAQATWTNAGFNGSITYSPSPNNGNWTITSQSLSGSQPCSTSITIGG